MTREKVFRHMTRFEMIDCILDLEKELEKLKEDFEIIKQKVIAR